ncbi:MAG: hypothetical protein AAF216_08975 [Pseudomonadota bacterium]
MLIQYYSKSIILALLMCVSFSMGIGTASAQSQTNLVNTNNPTQFTRDFLSDLEAEGISASADLFAEMGLESPQISSTITMLASQEGEASTRWTSMIGEADSAGVLRQAYAYSYLGNNVWLYHRLDFVRVSDDM